MSTPLPDMSASGTTSAASFSITQFPLFVAASSSRAGLALVGTPTTGTTNTTEVRFFNFDGTSISQVGTLQAVDNAFSSGFGPLANGLKLVANRSSGTLSFQTGGQFTRMFIDALGRVGIGTSTPYAQLSLAGATAATTTLAIRPASGQTANIMDIYNGSGVLTTVLTSAGNLGIGTTTPPNKLTVENSSGVADFALYSNAASNATIRFGTPSAPQLCAAVLLERQQLSLSCYCGERSVDNNFRRQRRHRHYNASEQAQYHNDNQR